MTFFGLLGHLFPGDPFYFTNRNIDIRLLEARAICTSNDNTETIYYRNKHVNCSSTLSNFFSRKILNILFVSSKLNARRIPRLRLIKNNVLNVNHKRDQRNARNVTISAEEEWEMRWKNLMHPEKALLAGETCLAAYGSEFRRDRDSKARGRDPYARSCGVSPRIYILNRLALGARV